jgi:hypothetical protein
MNTIMKYGFVALLAALPVSVRAGEQTWTGTITAVNGQEKTLTGKSFLFSKTFNLGDHCAIATVDNREASLTDLRPGEQAKVHYRDVEGVLVADRITAKALHYTGRIKAIDPTAKTVTMEEAALYEPFKAPRMFHVATDCKVKLSNGESGTLAALQPGDRIMIIYELPGDSPVAYRIRDEDLTFVGKLDAIDLSARTLKAKQMSTEKHFDLADHCRVILNGEKSGQLKDLALGQDYRFTYQSVNGVNVLDRVSSAEAAKPAETASAR